LVVHLELDMARFDETSVFCDPHKPQGQPFEGVIFMLDIGV